MSEKIKILLYGYGNPGRQDDGLGIACIDRLDEWIREKGLQNWVNTDYNYQLNIEDVEAIADRELVIFIDASKEDIEDLLLVPLNTSSELSFSMHSVSPAYLLHLCQEIYERTPPAFLLHIKGYAWEINESMTAEALENLEKAVTALQKILTEPEQLLAEQHKDTVITLWPINHEQK